MGEVEGECIVEAFERERDEGVLDDDDFDRALEEVRVGKVPVDDIKPGAMSK